MVTGRVGEVSEKYFVEKVAPLIVREAAPELVAVIATNLDPSVTTLPKSNELLLSARVPLWELPPDCPPLEKPWQPVKVHSATGRIRRAAAFRRKERLPLSTRGALLGRGYVLQFGGAIVT